MPHRQITGRLVIATHNAGKLKEMRELLAPYGVSAVSAGELGLPEPEETGTSFAENARIKAVAAATATGLPAFSDDSGLARRNVGADQGESELESEYRGKRAPSHRHSERFRTRRSPRCSEGR